MPEYMDPYTKEEPMDWLTHRIQIIKLVRQATGMGLKEAKVATDNLFAKISIITPDALKPDGAGVEHGDLGGDVKNAFNAAFRIFEDLPNVHKVRQDHDAHVRRITDSHRKDEITIAERDSEIAELKRRLEHSESQLGTAAGEIDKLYAKLDAKNQKTHALLTTIHELCRNTKMT